VVCANDALFHSITEPFPFPPNLRFRWCAPLDPPSSVAGGLGYDSWSEVTPSFTSSAPRCPARPPVVEGAEGTPLRLP
jgi:hypothetical protein